MPCLINPLLLLGIVKSNVWEKHPKFINTFPSLCKTSPDLFGRGLEKCWEETTSQKFSDTLSLERAGQQPAMMQFCSAAARRIVTEGVKRPHCKVKMPKQSVCQCKGSVPSALSPFFLNSINWQPWKDSKLSMDIRKIWDAVWNGKLSREVWRALQSRWTYFWGGGQFVPFVSSPRQNTDGRKVLKDSNLGFK